MAAEEEVVIRPWSPAWARKYRAEKARLAAVLGRRASCIEHIGSTAVQGLPAKPIVDVAVRLPTLRIIPGLLAPLEAMGYRYMGEFGLPGRHFFIKGEPREFHLHLVDGGTDHWDRWLIFRNLLRRNPDLRRRYAHLKRRLAKKYGRRRQKYTASKSDFVNALVESRLARLARERPRAAEAGGARGGKPAATSTSAPTRRPRPRPDRRQAARTVRRTSATGDRRRASGSTPAPRPTSSPRTAPSRARS